MSHYTTLVCVCVNMRRGQFTLPVVPSVWPVCDTYVGVIDNLWLCESSIKIDHLLVEIEDISVVDNLWHCELS